MPDSPDTDPSVDYTSVDTSLDLGSADTITEYSFLTEEDLREWRKEARRREQRRIKPGFRLPGDCRDRDA